MRFVLWQNTVHRKHFKTIFLLMYKTTEVNVLLIFKNVNLHDKNYFSWKWKCTRTYLINVNFHKNRDIQHYSKVTSDPHSSQFSLVYLFFKPTLSIKKPQSWVTSFHRFGTIGPHAHPTKNNWFVAGVGREIKWNVVTQVNCLKTIVSVENGNWSAWRSETN